LPQKIDSRVVHAQPLSALFFPIVHPVDCSRMDVVIPGEQHMYLKAPSPADRQRWLVALGSCKACLNTAGPRRNSGTILTNKLSHFSLPDKPAVAFLKCFAFDIFMLYIQSYGLRVTDRLCGLVGLWSHAYKAMWECFCAPEYLNPPI
jgi:hypothetical protein